MRASHLVLAVLAMLFVTASHAAKEYEVSGTLTNCTVTESGGGFHETCDLESADPMLAGTWSFTYQVDESDTGVYTSDDGEELTIFEYDPDDLVLQLGAITIVTNDGVWDGEGQRALAAGRALDDFWADAFIGDSMRGAVSGGGAWVMGGFLEGDEGYAGEELQVGGAGAVAGPPYALVGSFGSDSGLSAAANIGRIGFPLIVFALLSAGAVVSVLKGHWFMGLVGALGFGVFALWTTLHGSLDIDLLGGFEEEVENNVGLAIFLASALGAFLLLLGSVSNARPGSWWDRNRDTQESLADDLT